MKYSELDALAQEIADILIGQCRITLERAIEPLPEMTPDERKYFVASIDNRMFFCTACGLYCEFDEWNDTNICDHCDLEAGNF